jgi:putative ABC transport system permease protein
MTDPNVPRSGSERPADRTRAERRPPRLAMWLASVALPRYERETILGDLEEDFCRRALASKARANGWYWGQVALIWGNEVADRLRDPMGGRRMWLRESVGRDPIRRGRESSGWEVVTMWIGFMQTSRRLARDWRFSAAMTFIMGVGIGAGLVAYSVVARVIMQPLPYETADRLALIRVDIGEIRNHPGLAMAEVVDLRELDGAFSNVEAAGAESTATLEMDGQIEPLLSVHLSPGMFGMLGVEPLIGRGFLPEDAEEGGGGMLLSHAFWQSHFAGDRTVIERTLTVNGSPVPVLGVMPEGFALHMGRGTNISADAQAWRPMRLDPESRSFWGFRTIARLEDGRSLEQVNAALAGLTQRLLEEYPDAYGDAELSFVAHDLHSDLVQDARPAINTALAGVLLLLIVAFANSASLMLGRQRAREADLAVRSALGAGRGRLVGSILGEALVLAFAAGTVGAGLAAWGVFGLRALNPPGVPRWSDIGIDWSFFAAAIALAIAGFLASGLYPAWKVSAGGAWRVLRGETLYRGASGTRMRRALVGVQISLAVVLIFGALVLGRSTVRLAQVDLGFDPSSTLTLAVPLDRSRSNDVVDIWAFHKGLRDKLASIPNVVSVGGVSHLPLEGYAPTDAYSAALTADTLNWGNQLANYFATMPGYLSTIGVELQRGRLLEDRDMDERRAVAVVDQSLVDGLFPGEDPIGRIIKVGWGIPDVEIVGVIRHPRVMDAREAVRPQVYVPFTVFRWLPMHYVIRTAGDPLSFVGAVRAEIDAAGGGRAVYKVRSLDSYLAASTSSLRMTLVLIMAQAGLTALLSAFGLFSVMAYLAYQTRRATAIRSALGATRGELLSHHLRSGGTILMGAIPVGLVLALVGSRLLQTMVYDVSPRDFASLGVAAVVAAAVGMLATYLPARSASSADPMETLRAD